MPAGLHSCSHLSLAPPLSLKSCVGDDILCDDEVSALHTALEEVQQPKVELAKAQGRSESMGYGSPMAW